MGKHTVLCEENMTLGTGNVLAAIQSAAAGVAGSILRITRIEIWQTGTTTGEMIRAATSERDTAGTLTMTATTPKNVVLGGSASALTGNTAPAGGTARTGTDSSADSGGTYTNQRCFGFHNLNGLLFKPDANGEELIIPPSKLWTVRLLATPTGTTGWGISVDIDENG
jgi:hypothetical protein